MSMRLWKKGRQGTGYNVLTFWSRWFFDLHLIQIPVGTDVPWHVDAVPRKKHHRINVHFNDQLRVKYMDTDGSLRSWFKGRIVYFRPDLRMHMVRRTVPTYQSNHKPTYILSLGWVKES